jgi:hypothetical protein
MVHLKNDYYRGKSKRCERTPTPFSQNPQQMLQSITWNGTPSFGSEKPASNELGYDKACYSDTYT